MVINVRSKSEGCVVKSLHKCIHLPSTSTSDNQVPSTAFNQVHPTPTNETTNQKGKKETTKTCFMEKEHKKPKVARGEPYYTKSGNLKPQRVIGKFCQCKKKVLKK